MRKAGKWYLLLCCPFYFNVAVNAQNMVRIDLTKDENVRLSSSPARLAPDFATKEYGFFCRQELRGDKVLPLPVRFRVGSMQQADWLERKPNVMAPGR